MENDIINTSPESTDRYPMVIDGIPSHLFSGALVHPDSLIINSRSQIMAGYPLLSTLHGEHINDLQDNLPVTNHGGVIGSDASVSRNSRLSGQAIRDVSFSSSHPIGNNEFREQFMGGALLPTTSLAPLLETSSSLHENFNRVSISANSAFPLEDLRSFVSNGCSNTSNSLLSTSLDCEYNGGHGDMELIAPRKDNSMAGRLDSIWDLEKFMGYQELNGKAPMRTNEPFRFMASSDPPEWISSDKSNSSADNPRGYCMPSNELSLRLTTCQPSIISEPTIADKCSEISCSDVSQHSLHEARLGRGLGSDQTSGKSKDLSLGFGSCGLVHFSHIMSGSKYINVAQQILTEIASYSLENLDDICYSPGGIGTGAKTLFSSNFSAERDVSFVESDEYPFSAGKTISEGQMLTPQRQDVEAKKAQLLALLQVVDYRYNQCLDEIRTVISAFHAATELDPQIHARFVLQTISLLYNNLRDRIANQILAIGERLSSGCMREERSFESSFIQKQWALQQLRRKDHQSWRPQRGLPERSVSVLRAWMFQNFLHPYPKDTEKHLLAIRSGLTRSQVSNWFINARVRLWKPMIEEMYSEMNNRKGRRTEEGTNSHCRNHINIDEQRIRMN